MFQFPMPLRSVAGQREQAGKVSIFRGPLLLAWDQRDNDQDEFRIPRLTPDMLAAAVPAESKPAGLSGCAPWVLMELPGGLRLRDFATAGMNGTRYRSWLRAAAAPAKTGEPPVLRELKEAVKLNGRDELRTFPLEVFCCCINMLWPISKYNFTLWRGSGGVAEVNSLLSSLTFKFMG